MLNSNVRYNTSNANPCVMSMSQNPATKYDTGSASSADVVEGILQAANARYVREGWAIITDHEFTQAELDAMLDNIGLSVLSAKLAKPEEDFTKTDRDVWNAQINS